MKLSNVFVAIAGIGVLVTVGVPRARAWPPEVAPELEFTNDDLEKAWEAQANPDMILNDTILAYQKKFRDQVASVCPQCGISQTSDKYGLPVFRVTQEDGWYFNITMDPGTIEITSKPILDPYLSDAGNRATMQKRIWDVAAQLNLHPDTAGHLNYGIESTFSNDPLLFRNFLVDYLNHVGLVIGAAGYHDDANAPHPELLEAGQRQELKSLFANFDPKTQTIQDLAKDLYQKVYFKTAEFVGESLGAEHAEKYQAVNVSSIAQPGNPWPRLELRATTMENSADELGLLTKLFTARVELLKKSSTPIEYTADQRFKDGKYSGKKEALVRDFHDYVVESGLRWEDFRTFTERNPSMKKPLASFEAGLRSQTPVRSPLDRLQEIFSDDGCK